MASSTRHKAIAEQFVQRLHHELGAQLPISLRQLELQLLDSWPNLPVAQQGPTRMAQRWLHDHLTPLSEALARRMLDAVRMASGWQSSRSVASSDISYLTLVDDSGLDLSATRITASNMITGRCQAILGELQARLDKLNQEKPLIATRAVLPGRFIDELQATLSEFGLTTPVQVALIRSYAGNAAEILLQIYTQLNLQLADQGLLPDFTVSQVHSLNRASDLTPMQVARSLESLLAGMQEQLKSLPGETWQSGQLRSLVQRHFNKEAYASLTPKQLHAIGEVENTFMRMLRSPDISLRFRGVMKQLIGPLLTLRLVEPGYFENPHSPARAFIQQLAVLGTLDKLDAVDDFSRVETALSRIVADHGLEQEAFRAGSQILYNILHDTAMGVESTRTEIAEVTNKAGLAVQKDLALVRPDPLEPEWLAEIVDQLLVPWMTKCYEAFGVESKASISALVSAHLFFDAISEQPAAPPGEARTRLRHDVLEDMRSWMSQSDRPQEQLDHWYAQLDAWLGQRLT